MAKLIEITGRALSGEWGMEENGKYLSDGKTIIQNG